MISHPVPGVYAQPFGQLIVAPWWFQALGWLLTALFFGKLTWDHVQRVRRELREVSSPR